MSTTTPHSASTITAAVMSAYAGRAAVAENTTGADAVAKAFGYTAEELAAIPEGANMGLSCGNPTATASLREGEVVVDLGSGGGLDVFLAAKKVGPTGKAIGLDMTKEMVDLARRNAIKSGHTNTEFVLGQIEDMPLPDSSTDCVISNCVLNLVPDKEKALREIIRILKPGGRLAVSDIALKAELPEAISNDLLAYIGCISGAVLLDTYRAQLVAAGFSDVSIIDTKKDLNAYMELGDQQVCCVPQSAIPSPGAAPACCAPATPAPKVEAKSACCGPSPSAAPATPAPKAEAKPACCGPSASPAPNTSSSSCCSPAETKQVTKGGCGPSKAVSTSSEDEGKVVAKSSCCGPSSSAAASGSNDATESTVVGVSSKTPELSMVDMLNKYDVNDYAVSVLIFAVKPL